MEGRQEEMKRILGEIGVGLADFQDGGNPSIFQQTNSSKYHLIGANTIIAQERIDLGGISIQDKTVFFERCGIQYGAPFRCNSDASRGFTVQEWIVVSSVPYGTDYEAGFPIAGALTNGIGFMGTEIDYQTIVYGQVSSYTLTHDIDVTSGAFAMPMSLITQNYFGSGQATASDTLYLYRIILGLGNAPPNPPTNGQVTIPPMRFVCDIELKEEKEYQYMMRLKRSYELQNQPDLDKA
jgi:hypothetical protein